MYWTPFTVKDMQLTAPGHTFMSRSPSTMVRPVCHNTVVGLLDGVDLSLEAMQYYQSGSARHSWTSTSIPAIHLRRW